MSVWQIPCWMNVNVFLDIWKGVGITSSRHLVELTFVRSGGYPPLNSRRLTFNKTCEETRQPGQPTSTCYQAGEAARPCSVWEHATCVSVQLKNFNYTKCANCNGMSHILWVIAAISHIKIHVFQPRKKHHWFNMENINMRKHYQTCPANQ